MPNADNIEPTEATPLYTAVPSGRDMWMVIVNEGWRQTILCSGMYGWAANWLVEQLQGKPFALGTRP